MKRQVFNGASLSTSATNTSTYQLTGALRANVVNLITFMAVGQFAGAQVKLQIGATLSGGALAWLDLASTTISTSAVVNIEVAGDWAVRPHLYSASAGATSIDAWIAVGQYGGPF